MKHWWLQHHERKNIVDQGNKFAPFSKGHSITRNQSKIRWGSEQSGKLHGDYLCIFDAFPRISSNNKVIHTRWLAIDYLCIFDTFPWLSSSNLVVHRWHKEYETSEMREKTERAQRTHRWASFKMALGKQGEYGGSGTAEAQWNEALRG